MHPYLLCLVVVSSKDHYLSPPPPPPYCTEDASPGSKKIDFCEATINIDKCPDCKSLDDRYCMFINRPFVIAFIRGSCVEAKYYNPVDQQDCLDMDHNLVLNGISDFVNVHSTLHGYTISGSKSNYSSWEFNNAPALYDHDCTYVLPFKPGFSFVVDILNDTMLFRTPKTTYSVVVTRRAQGMDRPPSFPPPAYPPPPPSNTLVHALLQILEIVVLVSSCACCLCLPVAEEECENECSEAETSFNYTTGRAPFIEQTPSLMLRLRPLVNFQHVRARPDISQFTRANATDV